jgi:thymine-DNA glycosylase
MTMMLQTSARPRSAVAVSHDSADTNVETELEEVSHLCLSTPTQELPRSLRKRTDIGVKDESDAGDALTSKFWSGNSSSWRRTGSNTRTKEEDDDALPALSDSPNKTSRKRKEAGHGSRPSLKKIKREYAPPEAYAHLEFLNDYLKDHLDGTYHHLNTSTLLYVAN